MAMTLSRRGFVSALAATAAAGMTAPVRAGKILSGGTAKKTGYAFHSDFVNFFNNSAEATERAAWINRQITDAGLAADCAAITPLANPDPWISQIHSPEHIDRVDNYSLMNGYTVSAQTAARTAVSYALGAVKAVCEGTVRNAFCALRPPGHHAQGALHPATSHENKMGEQGYCFFANAALAARFARQQYGIGRILIIDWDFHQGNGTHGFIAGDNDILFFETFSPNMYTTLANDFNPIGPADAVPTGARRINVRMPAGSTNDDFVRVFEEKMVVAATAFKPELVVISCGFDLKRNDTHNNIFDVTAKGISRLTRIVQSVADTHAGGKIVSLLEGGYADAARDSTVPGTMPTYSGLAQCAQAHVATLLTGDEQRETPYFGGTRIFGPAPRPAVQTFTISPTGEIRGLPLTGEHTITLRSLDGRTLHTQTGISGSCATIPCAVFPPGRYSVTVSGGGHHYSRVLDIMH